MTFCFEHLILVGVGSDKLGGVDFLGTKEGDAIFSDIEEEGNLVLCLIDTRLIFFSDTDEIG